jgi:hypothetical protein
MQAVRQVPGLGNPHGHGARDLLDRDGRHAGNGKAAPGYGQRHRIHYISIQEIGISP